MQLASQRKSLSITNALFEKTLSAPCVVVLSCRRSGAVTRRKPFWMMDWPFDDPYTLFAPGTQAIANGASNKCMCTLSRPCGYAAKNSRCCYNVCVVLERAPATGIKGWKLADGATVMMTGAAPSPAMTLLEDSWNKRNTTGRRMVGGSRTE
ncbi:hypothetical protein EJ05DRAFT_66557 [Pseudovirgaria hyperparasitica]|uniref:Uncharacterized protein n=1 Tax=Pseudovirgaria hyperparasitica TaxID=470096 RepID=A0A6A6W3C4_9PEZI|nr:uncharacterized protein EJ05DRAFT_66557 [Pseudovirgaria hyperparasitica]KAF2756514.1 hypothetical protein EJ05DRAFT_66557 [Pseudovirgaria hyperparasitica]